MLESDSGQMGRILRAADFGPPFHTAIYEAVTLLAAGKEALNLSALVHKCGDVFLRTQIDRGKLTGAPA
jgi:hypothetical protein